MCSRQALLVNPPEVETNHELYYGQGSPSGVFDVGFYLNVNSDVRVARPSDVVAHASKDKTRKFRLGSPTTPVAGGYTAATWAETLRTNAPIRYEPNPFGGHLSGWLTVTKYIPGTVVLPDFFPLLLDFDGYGGSRFFAEIIRQTFNVVTLVESRKRYFLIYKQTIQEVSPKDWLPGVVSRIDSITFSQVSAWDPAVIKLFIQVPVLKFSIPHDKAMASFQGADYILYQSDFVRRKLFNPTSESIQVPLPDYHRRGPVLYTPTSRVVGMLGGISDVKGLAELRVMLETTPVVVLGCVPFTHPNLRTRAYGNLKSFHEALLELKPSCWWFHSDQETWSYTLTLALLTGLPVVAHSNPLFQERSHGSLLYDTTPSFDSLPLRPCYSVDPDILIPEIYVKIFGYSRWLELYSRMNESTPDFSPRAMTREYFLNTPRVPLVNEFQYKTYSTMYGDLKGLTESQVVNHWNKYGQHEGRAPNIYHRMTSDSIEALGKIYLQLSTVPAVIKRIPTHPSKVAVVYFETRKTKLIPPSIRMMFRHAWIQERRVVKKANSSGTVMVKRISLPTVYLFCTAFNRTYFQEALAGLPITYITLDLPEKISIDTYNAVFKSESFWNHIKEEFIFTFQTDGLIWNSLPSPPPKVSFLGAWHHDPMFGAFCINTPHGVGMNGGHSFRRKSSLLRVIREVKDADINAYRTRSGMLPFTDTIPEDCYFYHGMEMLRIPVGTKDLADRLFVQSAIPLVSSQFSFHGLQYHHFELKKLIPLLK